MKNNYAIYLIAAIIIYSTPALAQDNSEDRDYDAPPPAGMESRKVAEGVTVLMPQGGKMYKRNATTYVEESSDSYSARNFAAVNKRLDKLAEENRALAEEIKYLKSKMAVPEKSSDKDDSNPGE